ncbi:MAG: hypothetical protein II793_05760 [Bacteroidales bacterium]|nr:hypothetical protein [Bacteroidales bacterium]
MRYLSIILVVIALLVASCGHDKKEVVMTYADGTPLQVNQYHIYGDSKSLTDEWRYYADGTMQYEKHFSGKKQTPSGTWNYYYANGALFATAQFDGRNPMGRSWQFKDREGNDLFKEQYDTIRVIELNELQTPATVLLVKGDVQTRYQFYSNCALRSYGQLKGGKRTGHWVFYHPSGHVQTEADFVNDKENGLYVVYRENGVPYYRGTYLDGVRTGTWEFYDNEGNMTQSQTF